MDISKYFNPADYSSFTLLLFIVWSTFWKGWALWRSSKNNQLYWFIALLIVNTAGIFEIIYLLLFQRRNGKKVRLTLPDFKSLRRKGANK